MESTDHELHVFHIRGKNPGKTLLIIGGIHGNEPGGFLAADHYANVSLEQGNLIVVPRTNLASILTNHRGKFGDLNRRFSADLDENNNADKIIIVLKELMAQSDLVLNLHDGSGFYREKWIDKLHNPFRYGQALMSDSDVYKDGKSGEVIKLADLGRKIVEKVNSSIEKEEYKFHFANHDSVDPDTKYPEMRKTATYFALTEYGIPAYGVETSKSLPTLEMKVKYQILVINAFLEEFDIRFATPAMNVAKASVDYVVFIINGKYVQGVKPGGEMQVSSGDKIKLSRVVGNYETGMFLDYIGFGGRNDNQSEITVDRPLRAVVRKDATICCSFNVTPSPKANSSMVGAGSLKGNYFIVDVNGENKLVSPGDELEIIHGDYLTVKDYFGPGSSKNINVNFQGFVGNPADNRGEDRGYKADTARDLLKNWSEDKKGIRYRIAAKRGKKVVSSFLIKIIQPDFKYLIVNSTQDNRALIARKGDAINISDLDEIILEEIITNMKDNSSIKVRLGADKGKTYKVGDSIRIIKDKENYLTVFSGTKTLGTVSIIRQKDSTEKAAR